MTGRSGRSIEYGITDRIRAADATVKRGTPILLLHIKARDFCCSAFTPQEAEMRKCWVGWKLHTQTQSISHVTTRNRRWQVMELGLSALSRRSLQNIRMRRRRKSSASINKNIYLVSAWWWQSRKGWIIAIHWWRTGTALPKNGYALVGDRNYAADPPSNSRTAVVTTHSAVAGRASKSVERKLVTSCCRWDDIWLFVVGHTDKFPACVRKEKDCKREVQNWLYTNSASHYEFSLTSVR